MLDVDALRRTPLRRHPYDYVVTPAVLSGADVANLNRQFPQVPGPGSHPPSALVLAPAFRALLAELDGGQFRHAVEDKFGLDLTGKPTMFTLRGYCRATDGKIHTDSASKIITVLLYLNDHGWEASGGRLRILRSGTDLKDYADEVEPVGGTMLIFRRSDRSWHGHHPFEGRRRAIQMNWVDGATTVRVEQLRHALSSWRKRVSVLARRGSGRAPKQA